MHPTLALIGLLWFALPQQGAPLPRAVAAPAADLASGRLRLPQPSSGAERSRAAWIDVAEFRSPRSFDATGGLELALVAPDPRGQQLWVRAPGGRWRDLFEAADVERAGQVLDAPLRGWAIERFRLPAPGRDGVVEVLPRAPGQSFLIVRDAEPVVLAAWLDDWTRVAGEAPSLVARLEGFTGPARVRARLADARGARSVELAAAGDGTWVAALPDDLCGAVEAHVDAEARARSGATLARTALASFTLLPRPLLLTGAVALSAPEPGRVELALEAWPLAPAQRFLVAAELWGRDARGEAAPCCWLARLDAPREVDGRWRLALDLDLRWTSYAGVGAPFELRAVRVMDPDTFGVLEGRDALALPELPAWHGPAVGAVVPAMLGMPAAPRPAASHQALDRALMLVHGYCSGGNVWPQADFTAPKQAFLDPNANRTHDQFAQLLAAQGGVHDSFGVVAHSQGGAAALHLLTFYASPLDQAFGARRIQSVATPYQGTPLASLGQFACGVNNDMTLSGAAAWLANIPTWARAEVSTWTTSDAGSACNFLTSLFLTDPEDGTTEQIHGQLPGAHNMGHTLGWCHTTGMSYPANYTDHARNAAMNAAAAR